MKNIKIDESRDRLLLVEGPDDEVFFLKLAEHIGISDDIEIVSYEGKDNLKRYLFAILNGTIYTIYIPPQCGRCNNKLSRQLTRALASVIHPEKHRQALSLRQCVGCPGRCAAPGNIVVDSCIEIIMI